MKEVDIKDLENKQYSSKGISNLRLYGKCIKCHKNFKYSSVKAFLRNRKNNIEKRDLWNTCQKCWLKINTRESSSWVEKNSEAQKIAQNRPEQKIKNAIGVSRSWTKERRSEASRLLKSRWKNDKEFAEKARSNLEWTQEKESSKYKVSFKNSIGSGGLKGKYKGIIYESALELSYILWCEKNSIEIKRYDRPPIEYEDEQGKTRLYVPDFIINDKTIVEVKGNGLFFAKNYERNIAKISHMRKENYDYIVIFGDDAIVKRYYNLARKIHHENKKKNDN